MGGTGVSEASPTNAEAARLRALLLAQAGFTLGSAGCAALAAWLLALAFPEASARLVGWMTGLAALDKALGDGGARLAARLPWVCAGLAGAVLAWRKRGLVPRAAERWFPLRIGVYPRETLA